MIDERPLTYGDIIDKAAAFSMAQMIWGARLEVWIKPTRWQRFKWAVSLRRLRWWLSGKLEDLAYWIEP